MFQFFKILLGYNFPEKGKEMYKNTKCGQGVPTFDTKRRKKKYISFLYSSPYFFDTHALTFYYKNLLHK